jgi:hypothetical protein
VHDPEDDGEREHPVGRRDHRSRQSPTLRRSVPSEFEHAPSRLPLAVTTGRPSSQDSA